MAVKRQIIRTAESAKILISKLHSRGRHFPASIQIIERTVDRRQYALSKSLWSATSVLVVVRVDSTSTWLR